MTRLYEAPLPHYTALQAHKISFTGQVSLLVILANGETSLRLAFSARRWHRFIG
jgi:hypothetical protein